MKKVLKGIMDFLMLFGRLAQILNRWHKRRPDKPRKPDDAPAADGEQPEDEKPEQPETHDGQAKRKHEATA